jgi:hypothetical protein
MNTLTVRSIDTTLVVVPMRRALGTSVMRVAQAPLLLIDLHTDEGITGRAYLFCYLEGAGPAAAALVRDAAAVRSRHRLLERPGHCCRSATRIAAGCATARDSGLQQQRPGPAGTTSRRRRSAGASG